MLLVMCIFVGILKRIKHSAKKVHMIHVRTFKQSRSYEMKRKLYDYIVMFF